MSRTDPIYKQMGQRMRDAREAKGMSQTEVAKRLGITPPGYGRWETGTRRISVQELRTLATILEKPASYFLGEEISPEDLSAWQFGSLSVDDKRMIAELVAFFRDRSARHNPEAA